MRRGDRGATHLLVMRPLRNATVALADDRDARRAAVPQRVRVAADGPRPCASCGPTCLAACSTRSPTPTSARRQLCLFVAAVVLTAGLSWFYSHTRFGLASSAAAENQEATSALGWSPDLIAAANWAARRRPRRAGGDLPRPLRVARPGHDAARRARTRRRADRPASRRSGSRWRRRSRSVSPSRRWPTTCQSPDGPRRHRSSC